METIYEMPEDLADDLLVFAALCENESALIRKLNDGKNLSQDERLRLGHQLTSIQAGICRVVNRLHL